MVLRQSHPGHLKPKYWVTGWPYLSYQHRCGKLIKDARDIISHLTLLRSVYEQIDQLIYSCSCGVQISP